ncbi:unnamed protein product [Protopolystoma xenopodis]|uniref:Uncharacterized protein n=1 Tax=Protopolystoma xenopodis TaxID=117903 RepID=A0A3S5A470_9PLAT|nr:unnamed protein product [Protopolystoma xenopodis]
MSTNQPDSAISPIQHREPTAVSIVFGQRDVAQQELLVPQAFLDLILQHGINLETVRDFMQRYRQVSLVRSSDGKREFEYSP